MLNTKLINLMKRGVMIINTSHGRCVNTADIITGLETAILDTKELMYMKMREVFSFMIIRTGKSRILC